MAPVFSSIEEYLGRNADAYYNVLGEVGQGRWSPQHDARPWVRYCLTAHYHQSRTQLRRIEETERLYSAVAAVAQRHALPERTTGGLVEASYGFRLTASSYRTLVDLTAGEEISKLTVSRDLKAMADAGLLRPIGQTRGRYYLAEPILLEQRSRIQADRAPRETSDPFDLAHGQLALPMPRA
jgi:hypothetical protein